MVGPPPEICLSTLAENAFPNATFTQQGAISRSETASISQSIINTNFLSTRMAKCQINVFRSMRLSL